MRGALYANFLTDRRKAKLYCVGYDLVSCNVGSDRKIAHSAPEVTQHADLSAISLAFDRACRATKYLDSMLAKWPPGRIHIQYAYVPLDVVHTSFVS